MTVCSQAPWFCYMLNLHPEARHGSAPISMSLPQCPGFCGRETWWQSPEWWDRVNSGQIPDTDAQRARFEDVHSTCLLIRSHADLSPRKSKTYSFTGTSSDSFKQKRRQVIVVYDGQPLGVAEPCTRWGVWVQLSHSSPESHLNSSGWSCGKYLENLD